MAPVRVGIIGTGFGATVQLPGFLGLKGVEVVGVASRDPQRSEALQKKHKLPKAYASYEELIADDDVDLISVATGPADHEKLVRAAIKIGKHVLCEKPFTMNASAAKSLLKEANVAAIIHATDFEFRELPAFKFLIARLMAGAVGRIQSGEFRWLTGSWADPKRPWRWQCDKDQGGGVLGALGVHLFNAAELMLGPLDNVQADTGVTITERGDEQGETKAVTAEDHATIDLKGKYGIPVRILLSNVDPKGSGFGITITGDKGKLLLESTTQDYGAGLRVREGADEASAKIVHEDPPANPDEDSRIPAFRLFAQRLVTAIKEGDRTFAPSFQDGVRAQMFLEGVRASSASKSWVDMGKIAK